MSIMKEFVQIGIAVSDREWTPGVLQSPLVWSGDEAMEAKEFLPLGISM